jgi:hypothetical protein
LKTLLKPRISLALAAFGLIVVGAVIPSTQPARATPPAAGINNQINFQGRLLNAAGAVIPDGNYNMQFKLYKNGDGAASGDTTCTISDCQSTTGTLLWTEEWLNQASHGITVKNGYFSVQLGSITTLVGVDLNQPVLWLSMNVAGSPNATSVTCTPFSSCTGDGEMLPMKRITSAVYAINSNQLGGLTASQFAQLAANQTFTGANIFQPAANATGVLVKQNSQGSPTADIFDVQTQNATAVIQATGPAVNESALLLQSVGATRDLTLNSGSGTIVLGSNVSTLKRTASALTVDLNNAGTSTLTITNSDVSNVANLSVEGSITAGTTVISPTHQTADGATASTALTVRSGNTTGGSGLTTGTVTIKSGDGSGTNTGTGNLTIGTGNASGSGAAGSISIDTGTVSTGTAGGISIGTANAGSITIGSASATTSVSGPLIVNGSGAELWASGASSSSVTSGTNWLRSPKNTVTTFIGDNDNTSGYSGSDFSGDLRFNGTGVAWGDLSYHPNGGGFNAAGQFLFSTTGAGVNTTPNAKLGVGDLYVNGNTEAYGYWDNGIGGIGQFGNLLLCSEQFDSGCGGPAWVTSGITVTANSIPSPDGQTTADALAGTGASTATQTYTTSANGTYTFSVWLHSASGTVNVGLRLDSTGATPTTGTAAVVSAGTSWQRFSVTQTFTGTPSNLKAVILPGNGSTGTVNAWGAQLTLSGAPEVYVRTTNAAIGANQGVVSNGGLFVSSLNTGDIPFVVQGAPSQSGDLLQIQNASGTILTKITSSGAISAPTSTNTINNLVVNNGALSNVGNITGAGAITIATTGSTALNLTGGAASTWDIGANTLSLQTTGNGAITTGTGLLTQGGNITFSGTTARTITGPTTGGLTINDTGGNLTLSTTTSGTLAVTSAAALNLTGGAASTLNTGANTLAVTSSNFNVSVGGVTNVSTGYQIGGAAATGNYLRGNGTNFVSSAIQSADIPVCAGTCNYISNQTSQQSSANFNILSAAAGSIGAQIQAAANATVAAVVVKGGATPGAGGDLLQLQTSGAAVVAKFGSAGDLQFGNNANHTISIAQASSGAGNSLTIVAGQASAGGGSVAGGNLTLEGGAGNGTNIAGSVVVQSNGNNNSSAFMVQSVANESILTVDTTANFNLMSNPDFDANTTGWSAQGTGTTIAQDSTYSYNGNSSLKVTTGTAVNSGAKLSFNPTVPTNPNLYYTVSFYARRAAGDATGFNDLTVRYSPEGTTNVDCNIVPISTSSVQNYGWIRFWCSFQSGVTPTTSGFLLIKDTSGTAHTFWIDSVQLEQMSANLSSPTTMTASNGADFFTTNASTTINAGDYVVPTTTTGQARRVVIGGTGTTFYVHNTATGNGTAFSAAVSAQTFTYYHLAPTPYRLGGLQFNGVVTSPVNIQNGTDSTTALTVTDAENAPVFAVNTTNDWVEVGAVQGGNPSSAKLTFGDLCLSLSFPAPCIWIGEANNTDSDIMQLHGSSGFVFSSTYNSSPTQIASLGPNAIVNGVATVGENAFAVADNIQTPGVQVRLRTNNNGANLESAGQDLWLSGWNDGTSTGNYSGTQYTFLRGSVSTGNLNVGNTTPSSTPTLLVLAPGNSGTDPTGTTGAMYYNTSTAKFRCYQNTEWRNCVSSVTTAGINTSPAGDNTTTSGTYANFPGTSSFSFTKNAASTKLVVNISLSLWDAANMNTLAKVGVLVNGTDVDCGQFFFSTPASGTELAVHRPIACSVVISSVPAGSQTIQVRWSRASGTGTLHFDSNDRLSATAQETD